MVGLNTVKIGLTPTRILLKLNKPYFKSSKKYLTIIEPNVMFIKSNKKAFNRFIPDENNINNFELDYFDIFNINRLSGFDRFDSQSRVDYGIKFKKNQQTIIL